MSETQTLLLGFIAGATILLGLPLGRVRVPRPGTRQFLSALAIGILVFLVWDVLVHAYDPLGSALGRLHDGTGGIGPVAGYAALFFLGLSVGMMTLVYYERWLAGRARPRRPRPAPTLPQLQGFLMELQGVAIAADGWGGVAVRQVIHALQRVPLVGAEAGELVAQRRLCHVEACCGAGHGAFGGNSFHQLEVTNFELHANHYHSAWLSCTQSI